ncbi:M56 family metallopeptidase [Dyadobacter sandarakinus]|uniref:TonB family protein n=1 Tax=Dyadobacter sandarakinus TaxID=2747268 RepID=A0ABX7I5B8_9BACT|nr:M56 family metallopeptidase [Dyadobacter sandarakinus]QRR01291.1 TonB family protein [Dyadobacter sandarakinus]
METLIYLAKVNLYWVLLYACYQVMLRHHTFFKWNRFYLLGSLLAAFVLPLMIYPAAAPVIPALYTIDAAAFSVVHNKQESVSLFTWENAAYCLYLAGFGISACRLAVQVLQLRRVLSQGDRIVLDDCQVILSSSAGSFSFLKNIVISYDDYENHFDEILRHEMVHTRQWHSVDIMMLEILKTVFWFNPVLALYKRATQEVHEFLADQQAVNREHYARFLISYALNTPVSSLSNHFFKPSQIKTRIKMIYKNRTSKWMLGTYFAAAVLAGTSALIVAGCEQQETASEQTAEAAATEPKVYTVVEELPEFPGGQEAMFRFLAENLKYPKAAIDKEVEGKVMLSFMVSTTGETKNVTVLKGVGYGCDAEAVRVLSKFPKWKPGRQDGKAVNVQYTLPVNFQLEGKSKKTTAQTAPEPLYILDGVKLSGKNDSRFTSVNPDHIASINVLKGAQAREQFGSEGDNGVLLITTKKGSK